MNISIIDIMASPIDFCIFISGIDGYKIHLYFK